MTHVAVTLKASHVALAERHQNLEYKEHGATIIKARIIADADAAFK